MYWVIAYCIGAPFMFAFLASRLGEDNSEDHAMSQGRMLMSILWPIFLPILIIMWMQTENEDRRDSARREEWRRRENGGS